MASKRVLAQPYSFMCGHISKLVFVIGNWIQISSLRRNLTCNMTSHNDTDDYDALLARLTALKGSSTPPTFLSKEGSLPKAQKDVVDIESRFRRLASGQKLERITQSAPPQKLDIPSETVHNEEDDQTLEQLLAELNVSNELPEPEEDRDINSLLNEANAALPKNEPRTGKERPIDQDGDEKSGTEKDRDALDGWEPGDDEAADEYISQVLAELELENQQSLSEHNTLEPDLAESVAKSPDSVEAEDKTPTGPDETGTEGDADFHDALDLPSAPSDQLPSLPHPLSHSAGTDEHSLAARLAKLSLPSVRKPAKKAPAPPKYTDEEIESWCVICNEDATVRCLGCDGDLYCQACWDEGHRGKDAGFEERTHRAVLYNRKDKGKKMAA